MKISSDSSATTADGFLSQGAIQSLQGSPNLMLFTSWSHSLPLQQPPSLPWPPGCPPAQEDPLLLAFQLPSCIPGASSRLLYLFLCHLATPHLATHMALLSFPAAQRTHSEASPSQSYNGPQNFMLPYPAVLLFVTGITTCLLNYRGR